MVISPYMSMLLLKGSTCAQNVATTFSTASVNMNTHPLGQPLQKRSNLTVCPRGLSQLQPSRYRFLH